MGQMAASFGLAGILLGLIGTDLTSRLTASRPDYLVGTRTAIDAERMGRSSPVDARPEDRKAGEPREAEPRQRLADILSAHGFTAIKLKRLDGSFATKATVLGTDLLLIVDMGASTCFLDRSRVSRVPIRWRSEGSESSAKLPFLELGPIRVGPRSVTGHDFAETNLALKALQLPLIDGVIGMDVMHEHSAVIDTNADVLYLLKTPAIDPQARAFGELGGLAHDLATKFPLRDHKPEQPPKAEPKQKLAEVLAAQGFTPVPLVRLDRRFAVKSKILGRELLLVVDTGATGCHLDRGRIPDMPLRWRSDGDTSSAQLPSIEVGPIRAAGRSVTAFDLTEINREFKAIQRPLADGILGMDAMREHSAVIDTTEGVLYMLKAPKAR